MGAVVPGSDKGEVSRVGKRGQEGSTALNWVKEALCLPGAGLVIPTQAMTLLRPQITQAVFSGQIQGGLTGLEFQSRSRLG
jgi:hypothetical protein